MASRRGSKKPAIGVDVKGCGGQIAVWSRQSTWSLRIFGAPPVEASGRSLVVRMKAGCEFGVQIHTTAWPRPSASVRSADDLASLPTNLH